MDQGEVLVVHFNKLLLRLRSHLERNDGGVLEEENECCNTSGYISGMGQDVHGSPWSPVLGKKHVQGMYVKVYHVKMLMQDEKVRDFESNRRR
jgi:hypothetical protein